METILILCASKEAHHKDHARRVTHPQAPKWIHRKSKGENSGRRRSWGTLFGSQHFGGRGVCWSFWMGTRKSDKHQLLIWTCTNQTTSWLVHSLNTFGTRMSHGQTQTHKTYHNLDLGEATTLPLIVYFVPSHEASTQMSFPKLGLMPLRRPITLYENLQLR
jgi:hypothetical protein